jgi:hypothetical protein
MFIRISSQTPIPEILSDDAAAELIRKMGRLGIFADERWR